MNIEALSAHWHPIASSEDLPFRHVFHGQLLGRELAVWRADDGNVNVWENRCLHRGVRLSIGINEGAELRCQYHGWRYANHLQDVYTGELILVTEHGWVDFMTDACGHEPRMVA